MSRLLIQQYLAELARLRQLGGTHRESVVREAFKDLLKGWGRAHDLSFVPEYEIESPAKERRYVDGALLYGLRLPFGYWEAKDEKDDLDAEIELKFKRGYPQDNIIFDDSREAVLIQNRREVIRCAVDDVDALQRLLELFFGYERPEIAEFRRAVEQFKADLPAVCEALRGMIDAAHAGNPGFRAAAEKFLKHAQESINPSLTEADVREILIQHILTEEIFALVFPGTNYHEDNNIARELYKLEHTFFTGNTKHQALRALEPYYAAIRRSASQIASHHEKQTFLKVVYENFYKVYNPKAADRLGVVYTPGEIVRFMIESTDWLCEQHFGRNLIDKDVEILDPAAGTGTFICELLEHFRGQPSKLKHKYLEELHANEVAILPYYVANLNIEATYAAIAGEYLEYPNLCFVDTLDNVAGLRRYTGQQIADLFGIGEENIERIKRQNRRKISVVIGNPPYNANQANENDNNKNREYPDIDTRIKDTYIKASTAQKTKLYDMYARFFRWASDRIAENGVVAFVSNSSFIDARTFDGFRACLAKEFNEVWVIDLKGNARTSSERRRREGGNIFDDKIRVGIAVWFCVKKQGPHGFRIFYDAVRDYAKSDEKLDFLSSTRLRDRRMTEIRPDAKHNWLNLTDNDFDTLIPIATKAAKAAKKPSQEKAIFKLFSLGVVTNRDDWVYDDSATHLRTKVQSLIDTYNAEVKRQTEDRKSVAAAPDAAIKWTRAVKRDLANGVAYSFDDGAIVPSYYRPYVKRELYFSRRLNEMQYQLPAIFGDGKLENACIVATDPTAQKPWMACAVNRVPDLHFVGAAAGAECFPLYRYENGTRVDNITDWALKQFQQHYGKAPPPQPSPSGGGSAGFDPLPQRGRVGVGEQPTTHLFIPRPLPDALKANARELRGNLTNAEKFVWQMLRKNQMGVKFRRQHPVDPYVLDFYCVERKLAVEIDGGQHNEEPGRAHDERRTAFLRDRGIRVLRFWNNEVLENPEGVWDAIVGALSEAPPPQPSPAGGGSKSDGATAEGRQDLGAAGGASKRVQATVSASIKLGDDSSLPRSGRVGVGERARAITKQAIFHYVYAVLHDPLYREKYAQNLKRAFPRIPFHADFWRWADWGAQLMTLHIGYESVEPWPLQRADIADEKARKNGAAPKALLRADKEAGRIALDSETTLAGIPPAAWDYKLGNRSALEWILDQYKEKKPKDPTIRERFNTYRLADYKDKVIDLLARVTRVSVDTQAIVTSMRDVPR